MNFSQKRFLSKRKWNLIFRFLVIIGWMPSIALATVDFTATPGSGPRPLVVTFEDRSSYGAAYTRIWSFEGGTPGNGTGITVSPVTYYTAGTYNVTLKIYQGGQLIEESTKRDYITVYELIDYGDAPDEGPYHYKTITSDCASHIINNIYLGSLIDSELNGQQSPTADRDDTRDDPDEDGIFFIEDLIRGTTVSINVIAHNVGYLNGWVDFGIDGDWAESIDHVIVDEPLVDGLNVVSLTVPPGASIGSTYARFRYAPSPGISWHGQIFNGEVEDYLVYITTSVMDYGDAPSGYPVSFDEDGARHPASTTYYLGDTHTDTESNGVHDPAAAGDDVDGVNDEDGIHIGPITRNALQMITGHAHGGGYLHVWIDCNGDGDWTDSDEKIVDGSLIAGPHISERFMIPAVPDAFEGTTFARVRYSADPVLDVTGVGGPGEVEDHQVEIGSFYDYGDAPLHYPTLTVDDGASHPVCIALYLGEGGIPDGEDDGNPQAEALGDDWTGSPDENGVTLSTIPPMGTVDIPVRVTGEGYLHAWIDFDQNETWDPDEKVIDGVPLSTGVYVHTFIMPATGVVPGVTFARFRYSLDTDLGPTGVGRSGEVEDYMVTIGTYEDYDFGDAPASFGDPKHPINADTYLGSSPPDPETETAYSENADGDDLLDGHDDEDGVMFSDLFYPGGSPNVECQVNGPGNLSAFFDWNLNGDFSDPGERFNTWVDFAGSTPVTLSIPVPLDAVIDETYARFRFECPDGAVGPDPAGPPPSPDGEGDPGEVEDYRITVIPADQVPLPDYGDASAVYETAGAASHTISPDIYMGTMPDPEEAPFSGINAQGDDHNDVMDETYHAIVNQPGKHYAYGFYTHLAPGITGYVHAWIDFNIDNDWNDTGEKIVDGVEASGGDAMFLIDYTMPADARLGLSYLRVRFSTEVSLGPNGPGGEGEVEDNLVWIRMDFGDVPESYTPPPGSEPASHISDAEVLNLSLGRIRDGEFGPIYSADAEGDDSELFDDEDGITLGLLTPGSVCSGVADIRRDIAKDPGTGFLNGWIDFNQDNDWDDDGEHVVTDLMVTAHAYPLDIHVPISAAPGETFARFRLTEEGGIGPHGFGGYGEVEDYRVTVADFEADFGDAPEGIDDYHFPTYFLSCGAWHHVVEGVHLGAGISAETNGQPHAEADLDDYDDGVEFIGDMIPGEPYEILVTVSEHGFLNGFADYNGDGDWTDPEEGFMWDWPVSPGRENRAPIMMPDWTAAGKIFFRFRYTTGRTDPGRYGGDALDGEVEDYLVDLSTNTTGTPLGIKWSQPPLYSKHSFYDSTYWGWDEKSVYSDTLLADNWFCGDTRAVKAIRWWGSYADWDSAAPPPVSPESFHIAIWSDEPTETLYGESQPGTVIWEMTVQRSQTGETVDGHDFYPGITLTPDSVFRYQINLSEENQFEQEEDSAYFWLSVAAIYTNEIPKEHVWSWTTRETYLISDAVQIVVPDAPVLGFSFEEGNTLKRGWDCAFVLLSDLQALPFDFGDAFDELYPTSLSTNGAHHYLWTGTGLGENLDKEPDSPGDLDFTWDDLENTDDEDGIIFHDSLYNAGDIAFMTVNAKSNGILSAWADFNGDGDWLDFGERIFIDMPCYTGYNNLAFNIPSDASAETIGMRFRIAPVAGLRPTGIAIGGEVEDMTIQIKTITTSVEKPETKANIPDKFGLLHNYPNPFNPSTTIPFHLPEMAEVKITIYDILGRHVRTLVHGEWSPGSHEIRWDGITDWGHRAATGVYIYQIECSGLHGQQRFVESRKMLLLK